MKPILKLNLDVSMVSTWPICILCVIQDGEYFEFLNYCHSDVKNYLYKFQI